MRGAIATLGLLLAACTGAGQPADPDSGPDAQVPAADARPDPIDAAITLDAAASYGTITGACDVLDDELTDLDPSLLVSDFYFPWLYSEDEELLLSDGAQTIFNTPNEGGSSIHSEAFAYEHLYRCEDATLIKTEKEINYDPVEKRTDLLVEVGSVRLGVSVTRAMRFPLSVPYTEEDARSLLEGKLADILVSSANVVEEDAWQKQVLSIMAVSDQHAQVLQAVLPDISADLRADTIVWITVTSGEDEFIYCDGPCN